MRKFQKKIIAIFITLAFLSSGVIAVSATDIESPEITTLTRTITLYRYGIDGTVTPVNVVLSLEEGKDIGDLMLEKCEELLESDVEIQNYVKDVNYTFGVLAKVKSKGKGFHYQTAFLGRFLVKFVLFRLGLPRIRTMLHRPYVVCRYKDAKASTVITPLLTKATRNMTGPQIVVALNFIGYTTWFGRFSFSPLDIFPRSFAGFANHVHCLRD